MAAAGGEAATVSESPVQKMAARRINKFLRGLVCSTFDFELPFSSIPDEGESCASTLSKLMRL